MMVMTMIIMLNETGQNVTLGQHAGRTVGVAGFDCEPGFLPTTPVARSIRGTVSI